MSKQWDITFEQVNQEVIRVEARTEASAIRKATVEWVQSNRPYIISTELIEAAIVAGGKK